jgi:hypothetical protein
MEAHEFRQRRLQLGLLVKDLARLLDMGEQRIRNLESPGPSRHGPNRQLARLLDVAEEPGGLAMLERIAARSPGAGPATPEPTSIPEDKQVTLLATALVGDILTVLQQAHPQVWLDMPPHRRGTVTKRLIWLVGQVLGGEDGQAVLARRAVINARNARRVAGKNGKSAKKPLQSTST